MKVIIAPVLLTLLLPNANASAEFNCIDVSLPHELVANNFYSDAKGSVVDKQRLALTQQKLQPIRDARDYVEKLVDDSIRGHDPAKMSCALRQFQSWAQTGALTAPLANLEALYNRPQVVLSLSLSLIKADRVASVRPPAEVRQWLLSLAREDIRAYTNNTNIRNNLFYWAGAMAVAVSFLDPSDESFTKFAMLVWKTALNEAAPEGSLPQEMARGQRALIYQTYATNALLILHRLLAARGFSPSASDNEKWTKIVSYTARALCNPPSMEEKLGTKVENVEPRSLILLSLDPDAPSQNSGACKLVAPEHTDYLLGGNVDMLINVLNSGTRRQQ